MVGRALILFGQTVTVATLISGNPVLSITAPVLLHAARSKVAVSAARSATAYALSVLRR